ncbi:MAG: ABC transporter ATP-binding protein, partial [Thermoleophilia bacterium]
MTATQAVSRRATTSVPNGPVLEARGLVRSYEGRRVVDVDHLSVAEGRVVAILGPNGAGKSTLFRLLALLEEPDGGEVLHFGRAVRRKDTAARREVATVFQRPWLFRGKVGANVEYGLRVRRLPRRERKDRVRRALELTGISHLADAGVQTLSGGEAQRVALARALVVEPAILFLDEPTSNLDVGVRQTFRDDLRAIVERLGTTVVLITHDRSEALSLAHHVVLMRDGRIVQQGPVDEVYSRPRDSFVAGFMGAKTVWTGVVAGTEGGLCSVRVAPGLVVEAVATATEGEEVGVAIRPEDVVLSRVDAGVVPSASSARNRWHGVIESVHVAGPLAELWVRLSGGGP